MKQGFRGSVPLALMVLLMVIIGAYTQSKESSFLSAFSLQGLFIAAIPLSLAAMGPTNALMVRCFDVSIGALITLAVVIASFTIPDPSSFGGVILGMLAVIGACLVVGLGNILLTKVLGLSSIIATLATYSILICVAPRLRPTPDGSISLDFADSRLTSIGGLMPVGFLDRRGHRDPGRSAARRTGGAHDAASSRRTSAGAWARRSAPSSSAR